MTREEWAALARTFPTLRNADGVREGETPDPLALDEWATRQSSTGARCAAAFVLHVFDSHRAWNMSPFGIRAAWGSWDSAHRAAWQAWARDPRFA